MRGVKGRWVPDGLYTPPQSSDSNTTGHLWAEVERKLKKEKDFIRTLSRKELEVLFPTDSTYVYETLRRETRLKVRNLAVLSNYIMRNILGEVIRPSISKPVSWMVY